MKGLEDFMKFKPQAVFSYHEVEKDVGKHKSLGGSPTESRSCSSSDWGTRHSDVVNGKPFGTTYIVLKSKVYDLYDLL
jgi:hypothetical protein